MDAETLEIYINKCKATWDIVNQYHTVKTKPQKIFNWKITTQIKDKKFQKFLMSLAIIKNEGKIKPQHSDLSHKTIIVQSLLLSAAKFLKKVVGNQLADFLEKITSCTTCITDLGYVFNN